VLSQHFGDLGEEGVEQQWRSALQLMQSISPCAAAGGG
jgi:hydrogenase maturation protein HypF